MHYLSLDRALDAASSGGASLRQRRRRDFVFISSSSHRKMSIEKRLRRALKGESIVVRHVERLAGHHLHSLLLLRCLNGRLIVLKAKSSSGARLLRDERLALENESVMLTILATRTSVPVPRLLPASRQINAALAGSTAQQVILLSDYVPGTALSAVASTLPDEIRAQIDRSLGRHFRTIAGMAGPAFGPLSVVLGSSQSDPFAKRCPSWAGAFKNLVEAVLHDAGDMLVTLPYAAIRRQVGASATILDAVQTPRLVPIDVTDPANVLVDEESGDILALLGLGNAVFGDPLLATVSLPNDNAFWQGFGQHTGRSHDAHGDRVRLTLYAMYHSLRAIVKEHYRPHEHGRELDARRSLTKSLNELEGWLFDDDEEE